MVGSGILFRGSSKDLNEKNNLIKRELEYIKLLTKKKKIEVLQFPSTSFQILNCYMIVHYEYFCQCG